MKILVVSDTHGAVESLVKFIKKTQNDMENQNKFDEIWHLGDYAKDAVVIEKSTGIKVVGVKGNCDHDSKKKEDLIFMINGYRILLTHGHQYQVKHSLLRLSLKAQEDHIDLVCFGHTHQAIKLDEQGVIFLNPGSASEPFSNDLPSIGIITIEENSIVTAIEKL